MRNLRRFSGDDRVQEPIFQFEGLIKFLDSRVCSRPRGCSGTGSAGYFRAFLSCVMGPSLLRCDESPAPASNDFSMDLGLSNRVSYFLGLLCWSLFMVLLSCFLVPFGV